MPHLLVLTLLTGCAQYACTYDARISLPVEVVDRSGAPYPVDEVTYAVDGVERACEYVVAGIFQCGVEEQGDFVVRVRVDGAIASEEVLAIGATPDGCHVDTQDLRIVL